MEVKARIRFTTPCLGAVRGQDMDRMLRDSSGKVIFMQSWWRSGLSYAANALSLNTRAIADIQTDPKIEGKLGTHKRFYKLDQFTLHEAYEIGSEIEAAFLLPNEIDIEQFRQILITAGRFVGISPYGSRQDFGRFEVVSVIPTHPRV